ncbi:MAG: hypothetical protein Q9227_008984 [Pyrenula ochraceoflavens]
MSDRHGIPATGLTVVVEPEEPNLDIIFVHGFTGHPERTWTHKRGDLQHHGTHNSEERPSKIRRIGTFSMSHPDGVPSTVYWPRDLVPLSFPTARVLTYGYDTRIRHKFGSAASKSTVYDIAGDFLVALEAERRGQPSRPVIFVAHSLGGIIVKEMLRRSSACHRNHTILQSISDSTTGIMFFGTPHGGADPRGLVHHILEKIVRAVGFSVNEQIVNALLPTAERLRELRDDFGPIARQKQWVVHSFQEQLGVTALAGCKVVEDTSSCLNLPESEITEHLGRNHMDMCRFTGPKDVEYKKVVSALQRIATSSLSSQPERQEVSSLSDDEKTMLLGSLSFNQIDARRTTIKKAHAKTCEWLLKCSEYLNWLDIGKAKEHNGLLWMKGKPGAGKSTLMKFAYANASKTMKNKIIISFFFNARGEELEKSTIGTYRSLLLQLLERIPDLQRIFELLGLSKSTINPDYEWSIEPLKMLLEQAVMGLKENSVVCFIDALDECEERQIRDLVSFFEHLSELADSAGIQLRICFSSRHYPFITVKKGLSLLLEGQEGHNQDITNYLNRELKIGIGKTAVQIRTELQEKSSGVFLWVVLVVEILNKEYDDGRIHALRRRLREIPSSLHDLFRDALTRDCNNREELVLCIQWVLFARQPLSPEQLYLAIMSGIDTGIMSWDTNEITADVIRKFVLSSSKGLAEVTRSKAPTVQFIHESVKDFLLKENGLGNIWPSLGCNFAGQSHDKLKCCCRNYLNADVSTSSKYDEILLAAPSPGDGGLLETTNAAFPFLKYAVSNVLYHADQAAGDGVVQSDFIDAFPQTDWIKLNNLFERHQIRRYTQNASLLYILAENNLSNLIRIHPSVSSYLTLEDERRDLKFPKRRSVASYLAEAGDSKTLAVLLQRNQVWADRKDPRGRTPLSLAAENGHEAVVELLLSRDDVGTNPTGRYETSPLSWAAEQGHKAVVELLLSRADINVDFTDNYKSSPLLYAAKNGHEAVVELLMARDDVNVNLRGLNGCTPLYWAAQNGHKAVVELLILKDDVDTNLGDVICETPLLCASRNDHTAIVRLLLTQEGIDINSRGSGGYTPLLWAAQRRHAAVVELLIARDDLDMNPRNSMGYTPLLLACYEGRAAIVRLLLTRDDININARDNFGDTSLSLACQNGYSDVVELLLSRSDIEPSLGHGNGHKLLRIASERGHQQVLKLLQDHIAPDLYL